MLRYSYEQLEKGLKATQAVVGMKDRRVASLAKNPTDTLSQAPALMLLVQLSYVDIRLRLPVI